LVLFGRELENEIRRKTLSVALDLLVKNFHGHPVKFGDVGVEDYTLMAEKQDTRFHGEDGGMPFRHLEQGRTDLFSHLRSQSVTSIIVAARSTFSSRVRQTFPGVPFWVLRGSLKTAILQA
jgi:hypothetical protein